MYTHALWSTRARRAHLLETKYFLCRCKRCADPTELGTHLGTMRCPHDNGFILPKDSLDFESEWKCDSCPGILTASEVAQFSGKLEEDVDEIMSQARKDSLVDLLSRYNDLSFFKLENMFVPFLVLFFMQLLNAVLFCLNFSIVKLTF